MILVGVLLVLGVLAVAGAVWYGRSRFRAPGNPPPVGTPDLAQVLALEKFQVGLYARQLQELDRLRADEELRAGLRRALGVEREHVANLVRALRRLGQRASGSGGPVGLSGMIPAQISMAGGPASLLGFDVWAEEQAIRHYRGLLERTPPGGIRNLLVHNLVDEEYHTAWFNEYLRDRVTPPTPQAWVRGLQRQGTALLGYLDMWLRQLDGEA